MSSLVEAFRVGQSRLERIEFRQAWPDELPRAERLFPDKVLAGSDVRCFLAIDRWPVERIVAVAWVRDLRNLGALQRAEFQWGCVPGIAGSEIEKHFLLDLRDQVRQQGWQWLRTAATFDEHGPQSELLRSLGASQAFQHEFYRGDGVDGLARIRRVAARAAGQNQPIRLETVGPAHLPALLGLVSLRHDLVSAHELQHAFQSPHSRLFNPLNSALCFERRPGADERAIGAVLFSDVKNDTVMIPALIVESDTALTAGRVMALLIDHCHSMAKRPSVTHFLFRTNPEMSPMMPVLANRFGCRKTATQIGWRFCLTDRVGS